MRERGDGLRLARRQHLRAYYPLEKPPDVYLPLHESGGVARAGNPVSLASVVGAASPSYGPATPRAMKELASSASRVLRL